ncbi:MAG: UvrD-helicase domain-containing protein [Lachnospiraceae bacterium]
MPVNEKRRRTENAGERKMPVNENRRRRKRNEMSKVKFTSSQKNVIEFRNRNLLVSAAAGSGKTAVLTERIKCLIADPDHPVDIDHLLIVTFTNAAAAEMRERIGKLIIQHLSEHPEDHNMRRQQTLLYNAQITTIDSFCLFVIRNNFAAIGLDPGFRTMDDGEGKLLKMDVAKEVLESHFQKLVAGDDPEFGKLVECYSDKKGNADLLDHILKIFSHAESHPFPEQWYESAARDYQVCKEEELEKSPWFSELLRISNFMAGAILGEIQKGLDICRQPDGPAPYESWFISMKDAMDLFRAKETYEEKYRILHALEIVGLSKVKKGTADEELVEEAKKVKENVKKRFDTLKEKFFAKTIEQILEEQQYIAPYAGKLIALAKEFADLFAMKKREKNVIDFSDMEHFALQILVEKREDGTILPSKVAREYQDYFAEVMVDEYQDSNYVQEYILQSVSRDNNYFMVGDVKQSIYRFRQACPEIFIQKYEHYDACIAEEAEQQGEEQLQKTEPIQSTERMQFAEQPQSAEPQGEEQLQNAGVHIDLNQNFRSREEVLQSVNDVFENIMTRDIAGISYDDNARLYPGATYQAVEHQSFRMELLLLDKDEVEQKFSCADTVNETEESGETEESLSAREGEAWLIASTIRKMEREKFRVTDKESGELRGVKYSDIVILLRSIGDLAEAIKNALETDGIPVSMPLKTGYFQTTEVKVILNLLKVLDNTGQDIPLYGCMHSYFGKFSDEELAQIRGFCPKGFFYDAVQAYRSSREGDAALQAKIEGFFAFLQKYREMAQYVTIHDLLQNIMLDTGYLDYMTAFSCGAKRRANLLMLLEKAAAFEKTSYHGLFHFIRYIELLKEQEVDFGEAGTTDEKANVVRIMTIHKSKGLEFPVCILAGSAKKRNKKDAQGAILCDAEGGIGFDYYDTGRRMKYKGLKKLVMSQKITLDGLAEEMRILYVAMTRAREKLIITGVVKNRERLLAKYTDGMTVGDGDIAVADSHLEMLLLGYAKGGHISEYVHPVSMEGLREEEVKKQLHNQLKQLDLTAVISPDPALVARLEQQTMFVYPYENRKGLYTKTTVTELKKHAYEDEESRPMFEDVRTAYVPAFAKETEDVPGTRRGTAYHRIMELFPFEELPEEGQWPDFLRNIIDKNVKEGIISGEDASLVDPAICDKFLHSQLAGRMIAAAKRGQLFKEQPFFMGVSAKELNEQFPEEETILVQGVIDAYFEENGSVVIMDYKTDRVKTADELVKRYHAQLEIYARAITQITGKPVSDLYIYSFVLDREILL